MDFIKLKKEIFSMDSVKEDLLSIDSQERFINKDNIDKIIDEILEIKTNPFNVVIEEDIVLENQLYYSEEEELFLMESRLFNNNEGSMINAYLGTFKNNKKEDMEDAIDCEGSAQEDIWLFTQWVKI